MPTLSQADRICTPWTDCCEIVAQAGKYSKVGFTISRTTDLWNVKRGHCPAITANGFGTGEFNAAGLGSAGLGATGPGATGPGAAELGQVFAKSDKPLHFVEFHSFEQF